MKNLTTLFLLLFSLLNVYLLPAQCAPDVAPPDITCPSDINVNTTPGACTASVSWSDIIYTDNCDFSGQGSTALSIRHSYGEFNVAPILNSLGFTVTNIVDSNYGVVNTQISSQAWDFVVLQISVNSLNANDVSALQAYVNGGGKVIMSYWDLDGSSDVNPNSGPVVQNIMGISNVISFNTPMPVTAWETTHPIFNNPNTVSGLAVSSDDIAIDNGDRFEPDAAGTVLAGFTANPTANQGAIVLGNGGNTLYHGFSSRDMVSAEWEALFQNELEFFFNFGDLTLTQTNGLAEGTDFPLGTTQNTFQATDSSGNSSSCSFNVTVSDNEAPVAVCQNIDVQLNAAGNASVTAGQINGGSTDNCSVSVSIPPTSFDCDDLGANNVVLTATDPGNNTHTCIAVVTVKDDNNPCCTAPQAVCQAHTAFVNASGNASISASDIDNNSMADCGIQSLNIDVSAFDCSDVGTPQSVTLSITDSEGGSDNCIATVSIEDNIAPQIGCPANITVDNDPGLCSANVTYITPVGTDNCTPVTTQIQGISSGNDFPVGTTTNTFQVNDGTQSAQCSFTVTVNDVEAPVFTFCPGDITQSTDAGDCSAVVAFDAPIATDNCVLGVQGVLATPYDSNNGQRGVMFDVTATNTLNITKFDANLYAATTARYEIYYRAGTHVGSQNNANAWTFVGGADNVSSLGANVPTPLPIPVNVLIPAGETYAFYITNDTGGGTSYTDGSAVGDLLASNSDLTVYQGVGKSYPFGLTFPVRNFNGTIHYGGGLDLVQTAGEASGSSFSVGTTAINFQATDNSGNSTNCSFDVTVADNEQPDALCQDITVQLNAAGTGSTSAAAVNNGSSDNCSVASVNLSKTSFDCSETGANTVTLEVIDNSGNSNTCTATVTVEDSVMPTALCQDVTIALDAAGTATTSAVAVDNGSNDNCSIASLSLSQTSFDCSEVGVNNVTLTVTDVSGNIGTCSTVVTVEDNILPMANCQDISIQLDATGNAITSAAAVNNGSGDNCGTSGLSLSQTTFDCSEVGANTVTLTVTDSNGNTNSCTATVTVEDTIVPMALCQDVTITLDAAGNAMTSAASVSNGSGDNCGTSGLSLSQTTFDCSEVGANTVTLTVTDSNGNTNSCTATVTVEDMIVPMALCQDVTITLDAAGNAMTSAASVNNGSGDNCGTSGLSLSQTTFDCSEVGANTVTLTVTDSNGNTNSCTATVTVEDASVPMALCQDITIALDATGMAMASAAAVDNGSGDNCGTSGLSLSQSNFDCSEVGANTVTLTVTDNNGNTNTCTATVTVEDTTVPMALCQDVTIALDATGNAMTSAAAVNNGSGDNCGTSGLSLSQTTFDCSEVGANTVTLTVTDNNGNTNTCTATVTVEDTSVPMALCQDVTIVLDASGMAMTSAAAVNNGSGDNCGTSGLSLSQTNFDCSETGANTVTLTVTDNNGNTNTCTATVTVEDTTLPEAICQDITVQLDANGNAVISATDINNGSFDNCAVTSFALSQTNFTCVDVGSNTVTLTINDGSGNSTFCTANVSLEDNINPSVITQDLTVYLNEEGATEITAAEVNNGSFDNCGIADMTLTFGAGTAANAGFDCANVGTNTVTLTITDNNGNSASQTATITVVDAIPAEILCRQPVVTTPTPGSCTAMDLTVLPPFVLYDNCGIESGITITRTPDISDFPMGTTVLTWTVTDSNGNPATCESEVIVEDNQAPVLNLLAGNNMIAYLPQAACETIVFINAEASDNCGSVEVIGNGALTLGLGVHTHEVSAVDEYGLSSTELITIEVHDTYAPVAMNCPEQMEVISNEEQTEAEIPEIMFTDNCEIISVVSDAPTSFPQGETVVTVTAEDTYGLTTECIFTLEVVPTITLRTPLQDIEAATETEVSAVAWNMPLVQSECELCLLPEDTDMVHLGDYEGHQYFLYTQTVSWDEANILAETMDAHLLTMSSTKEQNFLFTEIFDRPELAQSDLAAWTGYYNQEESWQWANDEDAPLELPEIADFSAEENYALSLSLSGIWTADFASSERYVLIERECFSLTQIAPIYEFSNEEGETETAVLQVNEEWEVGTYEVVYEVKDACDETRFFSFEVIVDDEATYCSAIAEDSEVWLQDVWINNEGFESDETTGYSDFTEEELVITAGEALNLTMNPAGSLSEDDLSPLYRRVWIDLDDDGDFFGSEEMVFESNAPGSLAAQLSALNVPADSTLRMRIMASEYTYPEVCADYLQGETEDFTLRFAPSETIESESFSFTLAPNPADNYTMVMFSEFSEEEVRISLRNLHGTVLSTQWVTNTVSKQHAVNLSDLPDGMYYIEVSSSSRHSQTKPLMINQVSGQRNLR